ncbi:hypothetical protein TELCIR_16349, partial [Teladorsagia circumcincta]
VTGMKFFLGSKKDEDGGSESSDGDSESEEEGKTIRGGIIHPSCVLVTKAFRHAKKTRKRAKDFERSKKAINKKKKAKKGWLS